MLLTQSLSNLQRFNTWQRKFWDFGDVKQYAWYSTSRCLQLLRFIFFWLRKLAISLLTSQKDYPLRRLSEEVFFKENDVCEHRLEQLRSSSWVFVLCIDFQLCIIHNPDSVKDCKNTCNSSDRFQRHTPIVLSSLDITSWNGTERFSTVSSKINIYILTNLL